MSQLEEWINDKLKSEKGGLITSVSTEGKIQRIYGPRADFAHVVLYFEPADKFIFKSEVNWPIKNDEFNSAVMRGVLDTITSEFPRYWYTNFSVTLKEIKYHPVDSSERSFYQASRNAVEKLVFEHRNEKSIFKSHL